MSRLSKDDYYLNIALAVAERSTCLDKQYGAIIVKDDRIVSTGYNGAPRLSPNCCSMERCIKQDKGGDKYDCVAVHAEQNAIISASRTDMWGGILYLNCMNSDKLILPCKVCIGMILNSGIVEVVVPRRSENIYDSSELTINHCTIRWPNSN